MEARFFVSSPSLFILLFISVITGFENGMQYRYHIEDTMNTKAFQFPFFGFKGYINEYDQVVTVFADPVNENHVIYTIRTENLTEFKFHLEDWTCCMKKTRSYTDGSYSAKMFMSPMDIRVDKRTGQLMEMNISADISDWALDIKLFQASSLLSNHPGDNEIFELPAINHSLDDELVYTNLEQFAALGLCNVSYSWRPIDAAKLTKEFHFPHPHDNSDTITSGPVCTPFSLDQFWWDCLNYFDIGPLPDTTKPFHELKAWNAKEMKKNVFNINPNLGRVCSHDEETSQNENGGHIFYEVIKILNLTSCVLPEEIFSENSNHSSLSAEQRFHSRAGMFSTPGHRGLDHVRKHRKSRPLFGTEIMTSHSLVRRCHGPTNEDWIILNQHTLITHHVRTSMANWMGNSPDGNKRTVNLVGRIESASENGFIKNPRTIRDFPSNLGPRDGEGGDWEHVDFRKYYGVI